MHHHYQIVLNQILSERVLQLLELCLGCLAVVQPEVIACLEIDCGRTVLEVLCVIGVVFFLNNLCQ